MRRTEALEVCECVNPDAIGTYALPRSSVSSMCGLVDMRICGCAHWFTGRDFSLGNDW